METIWTSIKELIVVNKNLILNTIIAIVAKFLSPYFVKCFSRSKDKTKEDKEASFNITVNVKITNSNVYVSDPHD